ncbi:MAG: efflux RND transporter permease subunit [Gammaproteobacteria bacterium]
MIRLIVDLSLKFRLVIVFMAAVLLVFGIVRLRDMPVDVYPELNPPLVEVQTEALGLSAAEVESLITVPTEADLLNGVAWLAHIESESVAGMSSILLTFEPGTDPIRARQMVQERLTQAFALPNVSKPPVMLQPLSSASRVMMVGLSSKELSLIDIGVLARWKIKPRLLGVPGVANVAIWGQRERQLQVLVDPKQLLDQGVTLKQVIETTGEALWVSPLSYLKASTPGTAGWIDTPNQRLGIRHVSPITTAEALSKVTVVGSNSLLLSDVANVVVDHQPLIGDALLNNDPGLLLVIEKFPGANTLEVTQGVEQALNALKPGLKGVNIDSTIFRPANFIGISLDNLSRTLIIGSVLLMLVLFAFFYNWRNALISFVVVILSLVTAGYVLYLRGATINMMVFAGFVIALGTIVDDAVISMDNIVRRLRQHRQTGSAKSTEAIILEAAVEMHGPVIYATLILLLTILPAFFMPGVFGTFFQSTAQSYVLAILSSIAVALTVTPALCLTFLSKESVEHRESPLILRLRRSYQSVLSSIVQRPAPVFFTVGIIVLAGFLSLPFLRLSLLPSLKQTDLLIEWEALPGTSLPEMNRIMSQIGRELKTIPGVRNVGSHTGRSETGDQVVDINSGEIWVNLNPTADYDSTLTAVQETVDGYPGIFREVGSYQPEKIKDAMSGTDKDHELYVRVYGHDLEVLRNKAQEVKKVISGINGVVNSRVDSQEDGPQVEIEVHLAEAERHRISPGNVRRAASTLLSGLVVGNLFEEQKVFDVVVWSKPELRNNLTDIHNLLIDTPDGQVPLKELADIRIVPTPNVIDRDAVSRYIDVSLNVRGHDIGSIVTDLKDRLQTVEFPLEYHAEVLGVSLEWQSILQRLLSLIAAVVLGIFLLLQAAYRSWRLAFAAALTLPMALSGGVLAVFLTGGIVSLGSLFGFLAVFSIAVRNSVVLIKHFYRLEEYEGETFDRGLILHGAGERLVPILMTALATGLTVLPFVLYGDIAGSEAILPLAIVILGGLVTSTLLSLFVVPSLYLHLGTSREPDLGFHTTTTVSE